MSLKYELIKLLADGKFHSGQELGELLQVSRSAIWKTLQEFPKLGIELHSVKGRGYYIPNGFELLDLSMITHSLPLTIRDKVDIEILSEVDSTNEYIWRNLSKKSSGSVVLAEHQTNGRGRRQRHWVSPFGNNLYFSLLWSFNKDPVELSGLSLAVGVGVANTLERYGLRFVQLKWPNDILWNDKKISGVLIEMTAESHSSTQVVIGIGLNLLMPTNVRINQQWIDIANILNQKPERNKIAALLIEEIIEMLYVFQQKGFDAYFKHWQALDALFNKQVMLQTHNQKFYGISKGINRQGEFLLLNSDGNETRFLNGEVSLKLAE